MSLDGKQFHKKRSFLPEVRVENSLSLLALIENGFGEFGLDAIGETRDSIPGGIGGQRFVSTFLDASTHLYKRVCPSVGPSVWPSVGP